MNYSSDYSISISWEVDDILFVRDSLTLEQCVQVLNHLAREHDANLGINWDIIEIAIIDLFGSE